MTTPNSKEAIANMALSHLKIDPIISIDPPDADSKAAACAFKWYDQARLSALEAHPWGFAKKRANIASEAQAPLFEYLYKYQLPSDYVRMIRIGENWDSPNGDFDIIGDFIEMNEAGPLQLVYVYDCKAVAKFSPKFRTYLSYIMASLMSYEMTGNASMKQNLENMAALELTTAAAVGGQNRTVRRIQTSKLKTSRFRGNLGNTNEGT